MKSSDGTVSQDKYSPITFLNLITTGEPEVLRADVVNLSDLACKLTLAILTHDHSRQIELDIRFVGHAGKMLDALAEFAKQEPRKQARERASYTLIPQVHNTYANLAALVNSSLGGASSYWRGVEIPDIDPIGPDPPVPDASLDNFAWGVGEDADLILMSGAMNATLADEWVYRHWVHGFIHGDDTPFLSSAPAISRCSWNLLNAIHEAQVTKGLNIPSEATPVSFALWHGLKVSRPPLPIYAESAHLYSAEDVNKFVNGGLPSPDHDGMAWGMNSYGRAPDSRFFQDLPVQGLGPSFGWNKGYASRLMDPWMANDAARTKDQNGLSPTLVVRNGKVYMPMLVLHPVKTNDAPENPQRR